MRNLSLRGARHAAYAGIASVISLGLVSQSSALVPELRKALNGLGGRRLFANPDSPAKRQSDAWARSRPSEASLMSYIASQPTAKWIGGWTRDVRGEVAAVTQRAAQTGTLPVFVAYNIPHRDCGSYSAGGAADAGRYGSWIRDFAAGLSGQAVVVLEPDAVPQASCLSADGQRDRFAMLRDAVQVLKTAHAFVYLDAGNAHWASPATIAARLDQAGIAVADGFSLNVSNYISTKETVAYGNALSQKVGGAHYVIDTSRNGVGGGKEWCNASGQALGTPPTTHTGLALVDAFLWVKQPGESDGTCNGGPAAGQWWPEYALGLAQRGGVSAN